MQHRNPLSPPWQPHRRSSCCLLSGDKLSPVGRGGLRLAKHCELHSLSHQTCHTPPLSLLCLLRCYPVIFINLNWLLFIVFKTNMMTFIWNVVVGSNPIWGIVLVGYIESLIIAIFHLIITQWESVTHDNVRYMYINKKKNTSLKNPKRYR